MVHGRGNANNAILDQLRQIVTRSDAIEIAQGRGAHIDYVSDDESVAPKYNPKPKEDQSETILLIVLSRQKSKHVVEVVP